MVASKKQVLRVNAFGDDVWQSVGLSITPKTGWEEPDAWPRSSGTPTWAHHSLSTLSHRALTGTLVGVAFALKGPTSRGGVGSFPRSRLIIRSRRTRAPS